MSNTISLHSILNMLLGLTTRNKEWLADKLYESVKEDKSKEDKAHQEECFALISTFKQVKLLKEGKLETRDVKELLNECQYNYNKRL